MALKLVDKAFLSIVFQKNEVVAVPVTNPNSPKSVLKTGSESRSPSGTPRIAFSCDVVPLGRSIL